MVEERVSTTSSKLPKKREGGGKIPKTRIVSRKKRVRPSILEWAEGRAMRRKKQKGQKRVYI
jgi:hypothetical protein